MFLAPVLVLVGLYIISSLKVLFSSVSPWNIVPQNVVPQNTLSAFIWKGALAFEYNIIMIATSLYSFRFASSKINILFPWVLHTYRVHLEKKISVHFLQAKWYFSEWFFQVPLPFGTREVVFFHFISYDVQYLKQGSMEHHKNKSSWLSSKYIHLFKKEKDSFPKACLYINPARGHICCMLSLFMWLLYTTACFGID